MTIIEDMVEAHKKRNEENLPDYLRGLNKYKPTITLFEAVLKILLKNNKGLTKDEIETELKTNYNETYNVTEFKNVFIILHKYLTLKDNLYFIIDSKVLPIRYCFRD